MHPDPPPRHRLQLRAQVIGQRAPRAPQHVAHAVLHQRRAAADHDLRDRAYVDPAAKELLPLLRIERGAPISLGLGGVYARDPRGDTVGIAIVAGRVPGAVAIEAQRGDARAGRRFGEMTEGAVGADRLVAEGGRRSRARCRAALRRGGASDESRVPRAASSRGTIASSTRAKLLRAMSSRMVAMNRGTRGPSSSTPTRSARPSADDSRKQGVIVRRA